MIEILYNPFIWFIKLSLFLLYLEIFGSQRWMKYSIYLGITISGLFYFSLMTALLILCVPRDGQSQASYLSAIASPRCARSKTINLVGGVLNIVTDFYILVLPMPAVLSLQLSARKKIGVGAIFLTGLSYASRLTLGLDILANYVLGPVYVAF